MCAKVYTRAILKVIMRKERIISTFWASVKAKYTWDQNKTSCEVFVSKNARNWIIYNESNVKAILKAPLVHVLGWMDGWMEVKAVLRIAYSNQKNNGWS